MLHAIHQIQYEQRLHVFHLKQQSRISCYFHWKRQIIARHIYVKVQQFPFSHERQIHVKVQKFDFFRGTASSWWDFSVCTKGKYLSNDKYWMVGIFVRLPHWVRWRIKIIDWELNIVKKKTSNDWFLHWWIAQCSWNTANYHKSYQSDKRYYANLRTLIEKTHMSPPSSPTSQPSSQLQVQMVGQQQQEQEQRRGNFPFLDTTSKQIFLTRENKALFIPPDGYINKHEHV